MQDRNIRGRVDALIGIVYFSTECNEPPRPPCHSARSGVTE